MATFLEGWAAYLTEGLGGWTSDDAAAGGAGDAYEEAQQVVGTVADARGWDASTTNTAYNYLSQAYSAALAGDDSLIPSLPGFTGAEAELFWSNLVASWPADSSIAGWNELGATWESYAGWSRGIYEEALQVFDPGDRDWEAIAKAAAIGAVSGLGVSVATKLDSNIGLVGGLIVGGMYGFKQNPPE